MQVNLPIAVGVYDSQGNDLGHIVDSVEMGSNNEVVVSVDLLKFEQSVEARVREEIATKMQVHINGIAESLE